jgi:hypothetical protein
MQVYLQAIKIFKLLTKNSRLTARFILLLTSSKMTGFHISCSSIYRILRMFRTNEYIRDFHCHGAQGCAVTPCSK